MYAATNQEIQKFLSQAKACLRKSNYLLVPRKKNLNSLAGLGISIKATKYELLDLDIENYFKGPKLDFRDKNSSIWEFKKDIDGIVLYIKLKIENDTLKCLSFHFDEY